MEQKSKSQKNKAKAVEDRISSLPDEIISHILSLLPTKQAVVSSILAKRFRYLWTNITNLSFGYHYQSKLKAKEGFYNFVDAVFHRCTTKQIQKLYLCDYRSDSKRVQAWINEAIRRNVCQLELRLLHFPSFMTTCEKLTVLKMYAFKQSNFDIPTSISFPSLRILSLEFRTCSNILSEKLFQSCPALEDLYVRAYVGAWKDPNFIISAPVLKKLRFYLYIVQGESDCRFVIKAPNLEYMFMYNSQVTDFKVEELSSITESYVNVGHLRRRLKGKTIANHAVQLLKGLRWVKSLSLGNCTLRALDRAYPDNLPIFDNMTRLELDDFGRDGRKVLPHLLKVSPKLKALILKNIQCLSFSGGKLYAGVELYNLEDARGTSYWSEPPSVPVCLSSCLELVQINGFLGNEYELKLVKYLLAHATTLKRLTIAPFKPAGVIPKTIVEIWQELLEFPRCSRTCEVHLLE